MGCLLLLEYFPAPFPRSPSPLLLLPLSPLSFYYPVFFQLLILSYDLLFMCFLPFLPLFPVCFLFLLSPFPFYSFSFSIFSFFIFLFSYFSSSDYSSVSFLFLSSQPHPDVSSLPLSPFNTSSSLFSSSSSVFVVCRLFLLP